MAVNVALPYYGSQRRNEITQHQFKYAFLLKAKDQITTWHIHLKGMVQGVGFRPFIYQLAQKKGLKGWVKNSDDGVHIEFNAGEDFAHGFYRSILQAPPRLSHITAHCLEQKAFKAFEDFKIINSDKADNAVVLLSPDFALCTECMGEMNDPANRRFKYAFTTCTQCGPRYSIIQQLPYDREHTTMATFSMCLACAEEYKDPNNRRHYSQTNSCPQCAVTVKLYNNNQNVIEEEQEMVLHRICALWNAGKIVAIKGIGGYLLTCDAANAMAVNTLRKRKNRPAKPFALMFPSLQHVEKLVTMSDSEKTALKTVAAPIVLMHIKKEAQGTLPLNAIAPRLSKIGAMLPYAPLYQLLLHQFGKPVVATSGNVSNASIIYNDEQALKELTVIADFILVHNREIYMPEDDSVVKFSHYFQQQIIIRRARGYAPFYYNAGLMLPRTSILGLGALLKASFTLIHRQTIHTSQYLGDTDSYDSQSTFKKTLQQFLDLFRGKPGVILIDKHPSYFPTQLGRELAMEWGSEVVHVQHHEAHFASVLGEHQLFDETQCILGVIWDGTGLGDDGQIWGGEFFLYKEKEIKRVAHFDYFNHFIGDKMSVEPRLSAFALCHHIKEAFPILQTKFTATEWQNYQKLIGNNRLKTSSAGRLFDAVASLIGLIDKSSYEGEAAMLLEEEAMKYFIHGLHIPDDWMVVHQEPLSVQAIITSIIKKIAEGKTNPEIAAWFHVQLIITIQQLAIDHHCYIICCSGGVFQNGLLVDLMVQIMGEKHRLYFNKDLSSNDENISFGQVMWFSHIHAPSSS